MKQTLIDNNYLVIKNFIDVERAAALCEEFKNHCESNNLPGDHQVEESHACLLYTSPSPRDQRGSRMPSSA